MKSLVHLSRLGGTRFTVEEEDPYIDLTVGM